MCPGQLCDPISVGTDHPGDVRRLNVVNARPAKLRNDRPINVAADVISFPVRMVDLFSEPLLGRLFHGRTMLRTTGREFGGLEACLLVRQLR